MLYKCSSRISSACEFSWFSRNTLANYRIALGSILSFPNYVTKALVMMHCFVNSDRLSTPSLSIKKLPAFFANSIAFL